MRKLLLSTLLILVLINVYGQGVKNGQGQNTIRKATSRYYINDSTLVADSMFVTMIYYDKAGARQKEEETHYIKGKAQRIYTALYKTNDQLLEMRENGNITMKNEFDQHGTIVKSMSVMNHGKDTMNVAYLPKYQNELLIERKVILKVKIPNSSDTWQTEDTEYYTRQQFPDSTIITSTVNYGPVSSIEKKCYNNKMKLLYLRNATDSSGKTLRSNSIVNKYDSLQNVIEIIELKDDQVTASEKFNYQDGQLVSSVKYKDKILVKTVYEFTRQ